MPGAPHRSSGWPDGSPPARGAAPQSMACRRLSSGRPGTRSSPTNRSSSSPAAPTTPSSFPPASRRARQPSHRRATWSWRRFWRNREVTRCSGRSVKRTMRATSTRSSASSGPSSKRTAASESIRAGWRPFPLDALSRGEASRGPRMRCGRRHAEGDGASLAASPRSRHVGGAHRRRLRGRGAARLSVSHRR